MSLRLPVETVFTSLICVAFPLVSSAQDARGIQGPVVPPELAPQISEYVREVFQDRDGDLWFGSNGEGVARYDGNELTWLSQKDGLAGTALRGIQQDSDGAMWFGTDGGVSRYESGTFTNYTEAEGLSHNQVWSMMRDSAGTLWVGTHAGVCRFDGEAFVPFSIPRAEVENPESRFNPTLVWSLFEDPDGNIWFGTDGEGARKYDGESFTTYTAKDGLAGNNVRCILGDRRGRIWMGTNGGGLSCYDGAAFKNFTTKDGLNTDRVYEMLEDEAGNLWFSTLGGGACRYDGETFTAFGEDRGLTSTHVQSMIEDESGTLWFGCSGGLFRLEGDAFVNVTRTGPWEPQAQGAAAGEDAGLMKSFSRFMGGEWGITFESGTSMFDTWGWGPGRHSARVQTGGSAANGEPWRSQVVYYWHPAREQICLFGLSTFMKGVSEGTMSFDGETGEAFFGLFQAGRRREMSLRWKFNGRDEYHEQLLEATDGARFETLVEFDYRRSETPHARAPQEVEGKPQPSAEIEVLEPLIGRTFEARGEQTAGGALHIRSSFEWVPYADYVYARTLSLNGKGEPTHLLDAFVYHHNQTGRLHCLALSKQGGVYEGELSVLADGALQLDLTGSVGDRVVPHVVRFDFGADGGLRQRVWSHEQSQRRLLLDLQLEELEPEQG